jgi:hypothetical protein
MIGAYAVHFARNSKEKLHLHRHGPAHPLLPVAPWVPVLRSRWVKQFVLSQVLLRPLRYFDGVSFDTMPSSW